MTPLDEASTAPTAPVLAAVDDWPAAAAAVQESLAGRGVDLMTVSGRRPMTVDPLPRVLDGAEWDRTAAGLAQRVRALEAFLRDPGAAVRDGVVPADVAETCVYREPGPLPPPAGVRPAGEGLVPALADVLRAAAPDVEEPVAAVLGDPRGSVRFEPQLLADALGVPLVDLDELVPRGDRLLLPDGRPVDVLWRRTSEERLFDDRGELNAYGEALLPGLASGRLRVVNPFGTGVADDKRTYRYVEDLVRHLLGEEPLLRSVRTWDLAHELDQVDDRLDTLVLKPRSGSGGHGVTVVPAASPQVRDRVLREVRAEPGRWAAQEPVALCTCPVLVDGALEPRHVDLRPCVLSDGTHVVVPGGLTRVSARRGDLVVNLSQGGAAKDTWVLDAVSP